MWIKQQHVPGEWLVGSKSNILVANPKKKKKTRRAKCNMLSNKNVTSDDSKRREGEEKKAEKGAKKTGEMCCTNLLETLTNEQYPQPV